MMNEESLELNEPASIAASDQRQEETVPTTEPAEYEASAEPNDDNPLAAGNAPGAGDHAAVDPVESLRERIARSTKLPKGLRERLGHLVDTVQLSEDADGGAGRLRRRCRDVDRGGVASASAIRPGRGRYGGASSG